MNKDSKQVNNKDKALHIANIRRICMIDIGLIRMDRYPMNKSTLSLIDFLREGGEVPAIQVAKHPKGGYIIRDGRHRVLANKLLGHKTIKAKFSDVPMRNYA